MADDKKPEPNLDDWDSLPLDPDSDDWDDPPAAKPAASAPTPPPDDDLDDEPPVAPPAEPESAPDTLPDDFDLPEPTADDFDAPADLPPDDFDLPDPAPADDFDAPVDEPKMPAPVLPPITAADDETDESDDDFGAHLAALSIDEHFPPDGGDAPPASPVEPEPAQDEEPATKKVELDIEGIFLDDHEEPSDSDGDMPDDGGPEEAPPVEAEAPPPAPPEAPAEEGKKKIPRLKLLLIVGPAVLILAALGLGAYKLFFAAEPEPPPPPLVIDPRPPHRDPAPGDMELNPFYVNFPGSPNETIVEMQVVLHYPDLPNKMVIDEKMPVIRDIIFRITQSKGAQVISNGELQRSLRQELADQANLALGGEHITYVQINQFRILH